MNIKRCNTTGLLMDDCGHCQPDGGWEATTPEDLDPGAKIRSRWINAKYPTRCFRCGALIRMHGLIARHIIDGKKVYSGKDCCGH